MSNTDDFELTKEIIDKVTRKVLRTITSELSTMDKHMLTEIIDALDRGEDVPDRLIRKLITGPYMDVFIDELLKHEEE